MKWFKQFHFDGALHRPCYEVTLLNSEKPFIKEWIPLVENFIDTLSALSEDNRIRRELDLPRMSGFCNDILRLSYP